MIYSAEWSGIIIYSGFVAKIYFMKLINTKVHGALDYLAGVLMLVMPWLFGFHRGGSESWVPLNIGIYLVMYSLMTNYEYGWFKGITVKWHLRLDIVAGLILACSPWIFGFHLFVYLPHLLVGLALVLIAMLTDREAYADRRPGTARREAEKEKQGKV